MKELSGKTALLVGITLEMKRNEHKELRLQSAARPYTETYGSCSNRTDRQMINHSTFRQRFETLQNSAVILHDIGLEMILKY